MRHHHHRGKVHRLPGAGQRLVVVDERSVDFAWKKVEEFISIGFDFLETLAKLVLPGFLIDS